MTRSKSTHHKKKGRSQERDDIVSQMSVDAAPLLTANDVADRLKVTAEQVRSLIRSGRLRAINVGTGKKRPLYRLSTEVVDDFIKHGSSNRTPRTNKRVRRLGRVPDFFPNLR